MKKRLLLLIFIASLSLFSFAQNNRAFAITGQSAGNMNWTDFREIDLRSGSVTKVLFESQKFNAGETKIDFTIPEGIVNYKTHPGATRFTSAIAASAYDKNFNRLYYSTISTGELNYLDLNSKTTHFVITGNALMPDLPGSAALEENQISRMAFGADGNGYALTNDANHLIKFTTGKKIIITDLGSLVDASANSHISVHNKCSSWGGDLVADAFGKLYLFTAGKNIFKIDIETKLATYIGSITGLSGTYTLNGAAVDNDDNVIISCANTFEGFYKVNMKDLVATKLNTTGQVFNASDLASANLLFASQARNTVGAAPLVPLEVIGNQFISIFPNPVFDGQFKITFDNKAAGEYNIALTDLQGKLIMHRQVYVKFSGQSEIIKLNTKPSNGMYLIKITDANKKSVFSDKIVIE